MNTGASGRTNIQASRRAYYESLRPHHLAPLWEVLHALVTPEPATKLVPAHWRYAAMQGLLYEAGDLITAEEAERRVLILENPAAPGQSRITQTLYAGLQLILPGEVARCHRHTQSALRFVMEGEGAFTAVGGEKAYMHRWDLILTPNWAWHDHANETGRPTVWLDGLDIPLVSALDASFAEYLPGRQAHAETALPGDSLARHGGILRPVSRTTCVTAVPAQLFVYPYSRWREALEKMRRHERIDPYQGLKMEFVNPSNGGSVMPTIAAFCQLVPKGFETKVLQSTDGMIHVVVEGSGVARIGNASFDLIAGDVFVAPAWSPRKLIAAADLVLFSYSDKACQQKLGLWRERLNGRDPE